MEFQITNRLIAIFYLISLSLLPTFVYSQQISIYDIDNNKLDIAKFDNSIFILKHNKNCLKCFTELSDTLYNYINKQKLPFSLYSIEHVDSSFYARKKAAMNTKKIMPTVKNYFYDYITTGENYYGYSDVMNKHSIFYLNKVDITPAIILIINNNITYIPYVDLFHGQQLYIDKILELIPIIRN